MKNKVKWKFKKVCLMTLFIGGIGLMLIPPITLERGETKNKEIINALKAEEIQKNVLPKKSVTSQSKEEKTENEGVLGYLAIEKLGIEYPIKEGADRKVLSHFIGHLPETAGLGKKGNCVLAGHRGGKNGVFFLHLDRLATGDSVELTDREKNTYQYEVIETLVINAFDSDVKKQGAEEELTLLTCEEKGTKRLAVKCKRKEE